jgi:mannan endo-1,4-beta-mannosidase
MKTKLLFVLLWCSLVSFAVTPDASVEAENGTLSGGVIVSSSFAGYSGTGYVTNFKTKADKITVSMTVPTKGFYQLVIRYHSDYKEQDLFINGNGPSKVVFPATSVFTDADAGKYILNPGINTFTIQSNWGWIDIDKFSLYAVQKNTYNFTPDLINPNANDAAKGLYKFLLSNFNVHIISGQTNDKYNTIKPITGKSPLLRAFDFQHYTQGYPYLWDNAINGFKFGAVDDGQVQTAIDWYYQSGKKGIVNFHWHWHSPFGGTAGTNTFYTASTTFDVTKAVTPGTNENIKILQDIDAIAVQLLRLQSAGVPVLWRPLHEAGGGWFWWGAKGPVACKKLFNIMFDRLTNYYGLNNLIWVWSTPETDWYPGNDSIDIVGNDSYPGTYVYDAQKSSFDRLFTLTGGKKLIAMSENGPIPNPDDCMTYDAPWAYFMSWSDLVTAQNTNQHIIDVFNNPLVLTMESTLTDVPDVPVKNTAYHIFPSIAKDIVNIEGEPYSRLELIDLNGRVVLSSTICNNKIDISKIANGFYILRIYNSHQNYQQKLLIEK